MIWGLAFVSHVGALGSDCCFVLVKTSASHRGCHFGGLRVA